MGENLGNPGDPGSPGANSVSGGQQGTVVQTGSIGQLIVGAPLPPPPSYDVAAVVGAPDSWPLVGSWDARDAGTHPARPGEDGRGTPPYVPRDVDAALRALIAQGRFTLVVGDSTAGKTRAAFEAVRAERSDHRVLTPPRDRPLEPLLRHLAAEGRPRTPCLLWLDDIDAYLYSGGPRAETVKDVLALGIPVVATIRQQQYDTFTVGHSTGAARLLRLADTIDLERRWSAAELARAEGFADHRIVDAFAHHGIFGIAEYLAAGPSLLQRWRRAWSADGHARGAALVTAAVDLARTGLRGPYSRDLLAEAHERYLTEAGGHVLRPEPLDTAFTWAEQLCHGVTSLLLPAGEGLWRPFDYLVDNASTTVPDWLWRRALELADDDYLDGDLFAVGYHASGTAPHIAEEAWGRHAEAGQETAAFNLAFLLSGQGRTAEAAAMYEHAREVGGPIAAGWFGIWLSQGEPTPEQRDEAEAMLFDAIANEDPDGPPDFETAFHLAQLLHKAGCLDDAEKLYRLALACDLDKPTRYGALMRPEGSEMNSEETEAAYHRRFPARYGGAVNDLAALLYVTGRQEDAIDLYGRAVQLGSADAALNLGSIELDAGRYAEAEPLLRQALDAGLVEAADHLGITLAELGRPEEAEPMFRRALHAGSMGAAHNLGALLHTTGRTEEAAHLLRLAADAGIEEAPYRLALLLSETGRANEADQPRRSPSQENAGEGNTGDDNTGQADR